MEPSRHVTLRVVAAVASACNRLRVPLAVVGVAAAIAFVYCLANPAVASAHALLALTIVVWAALGLCAGFVLPRLPAAIVPGDGFGSRLVKRCVLLGYGLAIALLLGVGGFALMLSIRAVSLGST